MSRRVAHPLACLGVLLLCLATPLNAATAIGDWGHFISYTPTMHFNNPDGRAFEIKVHVMQWGIRSWVASDLELRLVGPGGEVLVDGKQAVDDATVSLSVAAGTPGVYQLHTTNNVWVESSLDQSVLWTGEPGRHLMDDEMIEDAETGKKRKPYFYEKRGQVVFQASVPRRWWFWVPDGTTAFSCMAMRADRCMSQREDWGYFIITPRGQRIRALWGQPPHTPRKEWRQIQSVDVEVEPGNGGRFWCLEVSLADSHQYSNINFSFDGVPPYLARSPEEWFDPRSGERPAPKVYDDEPFMQSAKTPMLAERWPLLEHFSPTPSLGDPEGIEILGQARFALWNPEGRTLGYRIGTYLPRSGTREGTEESAEVTITGPDGQTLLDKSMPLEHLHNDHGEASDVLETGAGVSVVSVSGGERWMSFTYPAVPMVLLGEEGDDGWSSFHFTACAARNWYFMVPAGTTSFELRFQVDIPTDVLQLEVCAPDRVVALFYAQSGEQRITVPEGLDGHIWYLRPSVGSATRMVTEGGKDYRYQDLPLRLGLKGVPACLAPTWEQWFDPTDPKPVWERVGR